ncbi:hypothetical protein AB835_09830 [Candidatus Endobugula sertula]|uniref:Uncharacterized protein n=1 Tax=Candidatus Endobugula sertula TaxID=62101 RepID=A0A1D2QNT4_9GAMM|nr:hypothetical protein AB835_09830 [Candidatus Endobugula sertula]
MSNDVDITPLKFDADDYKTCFEDTDLSEVQKAELLQNLWHIMEAFVHMGWGVDNISLFFPELFNKAASEEFAPDSSALKKHRKDVFSNLSPWLRENMKGNLLPVKHGKRPKRD